MIYPVSTCLLSSLLVYLFTCLLVYLSTYPFTLICDGAMNSQKWEHFSGSPDKHKYSSIF